MVNKNRRNFLKKGCLAGTCVCGFSSFVFSAPSEQQEESGNDSSKLMMQEWIYEILKGISTIEDKELRRSILKNCATSHYKQLNMDEILSPYIGDLDKFTQYLVKEWNWKVNYRKDEGIIIADENKNYCVCPLTDHPGWIKSSDLCFCSEGFTELMFSKVTEKKTNVKVISSIQRGDERCKYEIKIN